MKASNSFMFTDMHYRTQPENAFVGTVDPGIKDARNLLRSVARCLKFPDYFGENWNALFDCLRDFDWVDERLIFLVHADAPSVGAANLKNYLEVLQDAADCWKERDDHKLIIVFPTATRERLEDILG